MGSDYGALKALIALFRLIGFGAAVGAGALLFVLVVTGGTAHGTPLAFMGTVSVSVLMLSLFGMALGAMALSEMFQIGIDVVRYLKAIHTQLRSMQAADNPPSKTE